MAFSMQNELASLVCKQRQKASQDKASEQVSKKTSEQAMQEVGTLEGQALLLVSFLSP